VHPCLCFATQICSLGAGAAALVSLKLRDSFPGLKCLAFCCPGGLVSKNLAHAMRRFTTCGGQGGRVEWGGRNWDGAWLSGLWMQKEPLQCKQHMLPMPPLNTSIRLLSDHWS